MTKEEKLSPTVRTDSVMLTCVIDAIKRCDTAVVDIPDAFMQSRMKGKSSVHFFLKFAPDLMFFFFIIY